MGANLVFLYPVKAIYQFQTLNKTDDACNSGNPVIPVSFAGAA
jgi:hypothetical protein